jgi:hypothetical protein
LWETRWGFFFWSSTFTCPLIKPDPPSHNPHMWAKVNQHLHSYLASGSPKAPYVGFYECLQHPFPYPYHRHEILNDVEGLFVKCQHIKVDHVFDLTWEMVVMRVINWSEGAVLELNVIVKIRKYRGLYEGHHFISMAMKMHTTFGCDMDCFIKECAHFFHDKRSKDYLSLSFQVMF